MLPDAKISHAGQVHDALPEVCPICHEGPGKVCGTDEMLLDPPGVGSIRYEWVHGARVVVAGRGVAPISPDAQDDEEPIYVRLGRELKESRAYAAGLATQVQDLLVDKNKLWDKLAASQLEVMQLREVCKQFLIGPKYTAHLDLDKAAASGDIGVVISGKVHPTGRLDITEVDPAFEDLPAAAHCGGCNLDPAGGCTCSCQICVRTELHELQDLGLVQKPPLTRMPAPDQGARYPFATIELAGDVRFLAGEYQAFQLAGGQVKLNGYRIFIDDDSAKGPTDGK